VRSDGGYQGTPAASGIASSYVAAVGDYAITGNLKSIYIVSWFDRTVKQLSSISR